MKTFILIFLFMALFKSSVQDNCTSFPKAAPSRFDLRDIRREILRQRPSKLVDFKSEVAEDCYSGLDTDNLEAITNDIFQQCELPYEKHTISTADGYLLTAHHIPNKGKVVLLAHGLLGSSLDWIVQGKNSLAYILFENGYDVWLINARGNKFTNHENFGRNCSEFWNFTYEEIGLYDLPASVDYILENTGQKDLIYIGHSLGSTAFFVMASILPEYNDKISSMVALAPLTWTSHTKSPLLRILIEGTDIERAILNSVGQYEYSPSTALTETLSDLICNSGSVLCKILPFILSGFDKEQIDPSLISKISRVFPAGVSTKVLVHFAQGVNSGEFRRFDLGSMRKNLDQYGYLNPPDYPLENISTKVSVFYSDREWLSNATDVGKLINNLCEIEETIAVENYYHYDYLFAKDAKEKVYDTIVNCIIE